MGDKSELRRVFLFVCLNVKKSQVLLKVSLLLKY